ncbi:hypothetical protein Pan216_17270 [Planctomycetes bacterium Pan216]|uniref:Quinol:cytochrome C oxidoreductase n=1 Tax=Kolteria novifilia TaxID=2527975 RepID=A0A518B1M1_9BACT|nr:hypothetical protein Pan216_17270 [Planctomycetes bacterium Pan216]
MSKTDTVSDVNVRLDPAHVARARVILGGVFLGAAALSAIGWLFWAQSFYVSYLIGFLFALSIALGALFWVLIHHLVDAAWSVVVRRPMEFLTASLPYVGIFFMPIVFGMGWIFPWAGAEVDVATHFVPEKRAFLNTPFFLLRAVFYFVVWAYLARRAIAPSWRQDESGDVGETLSLRRIAPVGLILLGVTSTFASIDWIMSLEPDWFSTIFGVYFWSGAIVASLSMITLMVLCLRQIPKYHAIVTEEHLHDLGKLLFGFVVFWAYIAFSQYFLIWYANIPEETVWYIRRTEGPWGLIAVAVGIGNFVVPFCLLLRRDAKRSVWILGFSAAWLLGFHWLDLYWQIEPVYRPEGPVFSLLDIVNVVLFLSAGAWMTLGVADGRSLVPKQDPRLQESLAFENV